MAEPILTDIVIQTGLTDPWDIAFAPDGRMFVTERPGRILIFASPAPDAPLLATIPIVGIHTQDEAGALGLVLDPDFPSTPFLYVCASRDDEGQWRNQVLRYRVVGDTLTFDGYVIRSGMRAEFFHDGCRIRFAPDGKLWVTMGDAGLPDDAQDPSALNAKVLRVNPDGTVPKDNPIMPGATERTFVYTMGHRNPQGISFQPGTGSPFVMEHAHRRICPDLEAHDQITIPTPGANYGYPLCSEPGSGFDQPAWHSGRTTYAISGGAFVTGSSWGDWSGSLMVGALVGQALLRFTITGETVNEAGRLYEGVYGRLRSPVMGPDGSLYVTTTENGEMKDRIIRITPSVSRP